MELKKGDRIKLDCSNLLSNTRTGSIVEGKIIEIFDCLFPDGSTGNYEIDIRTDNGMWFRYKPQKDGGKIERIDHDNSEKFNK